MSGLRRGAIASTLEVPSIGSHGQIVLGGRTSYGNSSNAENAFLEEIGATPANCVVMEYLNTSSTWGTWNTSGVWSAVGGFAPDFTGFPGGKMIKVPIQTTGAPLTWTDVTGGGQDSNFTAFANWCVANGVQHLTLGWEMNGNWYPWGCLGNDTTTNQNGFRNTCQHIMSVMNAVSGANFIYWWNPTTLQSGNFANMAPGGAYYPTGIGGISLDIYNTYNGGGSFPGDSTMLTDLTSGNTPNWNQCLSYCSAHNLMIGSSEWGMSSGSPDGGDDPTYINNVYGLFKTAATTYGLTVHAYPWNNVGASPITDGSYPNALAALKSDVANGISLGIINGPGAPSLELAAISNQTDTESSASTPVYPSATGGTLPYSWTQNGLPAGLSINASTGEISGTPVTVVTSKAVTVTVTDAAGHTASQNFTVTVNAAGGGGGSGSPAYPPPGGVGSQIFNSTFSSYANGPFNAPYWTKSWFNGGECDQVYTSASNANIVDGQLVLTLSNAVYGGTGAAVSTNPADGGVNTGGFQYTYGYLESSFVIPAGGWWTLWITGQSWPTDGECDIAENLFGTVGIKSTYHSGGYVETGPSIVWSPQPSVGETIVAGCLWESGVCYCYQNGVLMATLDNTGVVDVPQYIVLNMGYGSGTTNNNGDAMKINYVRVWNLP